MYHLGVDLGGTNIAVGVVDDNFKIIGRSNVKTERSNGADAIVDNIVLAVEEAIKSTNISQKDIVAVGLGSPGSIDSENGIVVWSENLGFNRLPLCSILKERTGFDFYIENDANAAAYGEFIAGVGIGKNSLVAITLGTGVGSGVIIDKKIFAGINHTGTEIGHTVICFDGIPCNCGRKGCWETYASATALIRQTKEKMLEHKDSIMWEISPDIEAVNGRTSFDAMRKGDKYAKEVVEQYIEYVAIGVCDVVNVFQPDVLCIGGGISKEGDTLILPIREYFNKCGYTRTYKENTIITTAKLGNDAGIIGAAFLCDLYKK